MSIIISMGTGMLQKVSILVVRTASTLELRRSSVSELDSWCESSRCKQAEG